MAVAILDTPGYNYWTAPEGVIGTVTLVLRGRGADGQPGNGGGGGGSSGGSGAYARYVITVAGGSTYTLYNGQADGEDTWFNDSSICRVRGGTVTSGGVADSPGSPAYQAAGNNGGSSGGEAGYPGADAPDELGGPATSIPGTGGVADGGNGGNYGAGAASGGSYFYDHGGGDTGYTSDPGGVAGLSAVELQWEIEPPDYVTQQYLEVFGETPPAISQQYVEVFGEVLPPLNVDLLSPHFIDSDTQTPTIVANLAIGLDLQKLDAIESFTSQAAFAVDVNLNLQTVAHDFLGAPWGLAYNVDLELQVVNEPVVFPATAQIDIAIDLALQTVEVEHYTTDWQFSITPALRVLDEPLLLSTTIGIDVSITLSLQEISLIEFPLETLYGAEVDLSLQAIPEPGLLNPLSTIFTPHPTNTPGLSHFAEQSRSGSSVIVFGSEPGPFKLNPSAVCYRRNGRSHILHLARVKPQIVENYGLFDLLGPAVELSIKEFDYKAPGGYLEIWNDIVLLSTIQPETGDWDTSTPQILIDATVTQDVFGAFAATSFTPPRDLHQ